MWWKWSPTLPVLMNHGLKPNPINRRETAASAKFPAHWTRANEQQRFPSLTCVEAPKFLSTFRTLPLSPPLPTSSPSPSHTRNDTTRHNLTSCMCTHRVINTCNRRAFSLSIPTHRLTWEKLLVLAASERLSLAVSQSAGVHAYSFLSVYILHTHREKERERSYMEQNLTCIVKRIFNLRCSCCKNYGLLTRFKADQLFLEPSSGTDAITCPFSLCRNSAYSLIQFQRPWLDVCEFWCSSPSPMRSYHTMY